MFYSHPTTMERIGMAINYKEMGSGDEGVELEVKE